MIGAIGADADGVGGARIGGVGAIGEPIGGESLGAKGGELVALEYAITLDSDKPFVGRVAERLGEPSPALARGAECARIARIVRVVTAAPTRRGGLII